MNVIDKLKQAWGEKADALDCIAHIRIDDPAGKLSFYVIAVDPHDEEKMMCIIDSPVSLEIAVVNSRDIFALFDSDGSNAQIDTTWRPQKASVLYKKLREKHGLY